MHSTGSALDYPQDSLTVRPNAVYAAVCIATNVLTHRSARHWPGPQHYARPRYAARRIADIRAVHNRTCQLAAERYARKSQQCAACETRECKFCKRLTLPHKRLLIS